MKVTTLLTAIAIASGTIATAQMAPAPEPNVKYCTVESKKVGGVEELVLQGILSQAEGGTFLLIAGQTQEIWDSKSVKSCIIVPGEKVSAETLNALNGTPVTITAEKLDEARAKAISIEKLGE